MSNIDRVAILTVIRQLSGQDNIFTIPKLYVRFMDGLDGGLFLNQLVFWSDKGKRSDGFIYKSRQEWQEETLVSDYTLRKATKKLKDLGLLETKLLKAVGAPTLHYRLDLEGLLEELIRFVDSANGIVEINKTDSSKSTKHGIVEINKTLTDDYQMNTQQGGGDDDGDEKKKDNRIILLLELAQDEQQQLDLKVARERVKPYTIEQVNSLVEYARKASGLRDRLAFVIARLKSGELPEVIDSDDNRDRYAEDIYGEEEVKLERESKEKDPALARAREIWLAVLGELQLQMTKETFNTWLKPVKALVHENGTLTVAVENNYAKEWLDNRLKTTIQRTLTSIAGEPVELVIMVDGESDG